MDEAAGQGSYTVHKIKLLMKKFSQRKVVLTHPLAVKMSAALGLSQGHLRVLRDKFDAIDVDESGLVARRPARFSLGALSLSLEVTLCVCARTLCLTDTSPLSGADRAVRGLGRGENAAHR